MYRVELFLTNYGEVRLEEFRFYHPDTATPLVTVNGGSPSYCVGSSRNLFNWTVGVRAATLLLLKAAYGDKPATLVGEAKSLAASLDYALSKEPGWLFDFFGMTSQGTAIARTLFGRRNSERKRPGPVEIYINDGILPSKDISIFLNNERADSQQIKALIEAIQGGVFQRSALVSESGPVAAFESGKEASLVGENDFPLVALKRRIHEVIDLAAEQVHMSGVTLFRNTSIAPVSFTHFNIYQNPPTGPQNIRVESTDERNMKCEEVIGVDGKRRMLVKFARPLLPGEERKVKLRYDVFGFNDLDSRLSHVVSLPTEELTLEMSCTSLYRIVGSAIMAEREGGFIFSALPKVTRKRTAQGEPSLRWTMTNPQLGYCYRLLWGLEERKERFIGKVVEQTQEMTVSPVA